MRLIESDRFPFEFLSQLAERESWRKEVHRPVYHVHKWWAKRLGSVFRGILLGCSLPEDGDLAADFYRPHAFTNLTVFDPFMGSGTTIGEAHKLGATAIGRDINPVAVAAVRTAFGPMDRKGIRAAFEELSEGVGQTLRAIYRSKDSTGRDCDVLYFFWVMRANCPTCQQMVELFPSWVIARNANPGKRPEVQVLCPSCGDIFSGRYGQNKATCPSCSHQYDPQTGPAKGAKALCPHCHGMFTIVDAVARNKSRPAFKLYGKLVLRRDGAKEYLRATVEDQAAYQACSAKLREEVERGRILLPTLELEHGYNTRQAMRYAFTSWRDFFNDRQLLALGSLRSAIVRISDKSTKDALLTLFSGVLEFNNLFASYKGEGTGAVRHMFSHHILKPERTPIEANVWGTPKSSGSFSNLFRSRLLRAIDYRLAPTELSGGNGGTGRLCAQPFTGKLEKQWPEDGVFSPRAVYISCGDSAGTGLPDRSVDLIVTDPPFFDNVHYSELADFFFAWQQLTTKSDVNLASTTRSPSEVQDSDADHFAAKLMGVFRECRRLLKDDGLLAFTYHHSRREGWKALADAVLGAGFNVVNSQPVKSEMSVATPKSQAKEPIQLDIIIVCRKKDSSEPYRPQPVSAAIKSARLKLGRLRQAGFNLSRNDRKIVLFGQLLPTLMNANDADAIARTIESEVATTMGEEWIPPKRESQQLLFGDA
ncbi:MAG: DNA methyltransferase [Thermoguttaceae bacterium]